MRYLITGGSGYIGGRLTDLLSQREETEKIVDVDLKPPPRIHPKTEFVRADVRDSNAIRGLLERNEIDALVHLAFIFNPMRDEATMYDIDVNGTQATLRAASEAGTGQVLVTSSASAYGAFPDNPKPITEDWPVRGAPDFSYARDKADADRVCQLWAADHPDRVMTIVRPCIVLGPNVDNFISRGWTDGPFMPVIDGHDEELQIVHEEDVVSALVALLDKKAAGAFNLAGDGTMTWRESAEIIGLRTREISMKAAKRLAGAMWKMRVPRAEAPPGNADFLRYPWVVSTEKLKAETGWSPAYSSRAAFEDAMRAKGKLQAEPEPAPVPAT